MNVPLAWAQGLDGSGVLVGHTDSGVAWDHPDFAGKLWDGAPDYPHHGYDFLDEDDDFRKLLISHLMSMLSG